MAPVRRLRGPLLQQARADLFRAHPFCQPCEDQGRRTRATIRKHVVPLEDGGTEDASNIIAVCLDCCDAAHEAAAQRGVPPSGLGQLTDAFRKRATPRDEAGLFSVRRATRMQFPDADTPIPPPMKKKKIPAKARTSTAAKSKQAMAETAAAPQGRRQHRVLAAVFRFMDRNGLHPKNVHSSVELVEAIDAIYAAD